MRQRFEDVGIFLSPGASGNVKTICPECSNGRKKHRDPCLSVNVETGVWNCHHCGWSGGLREERPPRKVEYRKPNYVARSAEVAPAVLSWFSDRAITPAVLQRNQVGAGKAFFPQAEQELPCVMFPYLRGTEVVNVKYRTRDKLFRMEHGAELCLYGLNDIAETTIWVEGEIDKLSMEVAEFRNCVSVPNGAPPPTIKSYGARFDFLAEPTIEKVKTHVIAVDSDAPGQRLRAELVRRLGPENCLVIDWPEGCKDANDVLVKLGVDALIGCVRDAAPLPITGAYAVERWAAAYDSLYENGRTRGLSSGWTALDKLYRIRAGEWTLVTGIPGHGKTEWLDALAMNLMSSAGWRIAIYSPENWPVEEHLAKLAEKRIGAPFEDGPTPRMSRDEAVAARHWLDRYVRFIYPESPTIASILSIARQLVKRDGISGLIIDPWNEVEHSRPQGMTETEYISETLSEIRRFCRDCAVHVWLAAHPQKLLRDKDGNYPVPTPYDVSGSAHWRNKADNCITIWRRVDEEAKAEVEIHVQKIRHKVVGRVGIAKLNYNKINGRYSDQTATVKSYAERDG